jgi:hypothetical protein
VNLEMEEILAFVAIPKVVPGLACHLERCDAPVVLR